MMLKCYHATLLCSIYCDYIINTYYFIVPVLCLLFDKCYLFMI
uniref:Uncharacterized protein n=1 Tax=Rhizophora mucronata TaxID=61149 RepID=A0A2P2PHF2_RHIMU